MTQIAGDQKKQFNGTIYSRFSDVPDELISNHFVGDATVSHMLSKCKGYAERLIQEDTSAKLITLLNLLSCRKKVDVLDYGGGMGQLFFSVKKYLNFPDAVAWHVLDTEEMINIARQKMKGEEKLSFCRSIKEIEKVDILFFRQSLQVLEEPKKILQDIARSFQPKIIFLSGVPAGENEDYITLVLVEEDKGVPCWIFNEKKLLNAVGGEGYFLLDKFTENIRINLSNFSDMKFHLDGEKRNYVKGYIFLKEDFKSKII